VDNPRKLAFNSLVRADALQSFSNLEINTVISRSDMNKKNAALYTALYMGVTEKLLTLDYVISQYSSIKIEKLDIETKNALRLGLYQLMFMDKIPEYSAVSETVNLCPKRSKGYVNAMLRSFIRAEMAVEYPMDKWESLSVTSSTPPYIIDIFRRSYGDEVAEKIVNTSASHKGISLRVNTLKNSVDAVRSLLDKRNIKQ
jgi:16S rRNA (cytosine967-C5)-methyltransferase